MVWRGGLQENFCYGGWGVGWGLTPMAFEKSKAIAWGCCLKISGFNPQQPSRWSIIDTFQGIILTTTPSYIFVENSWKSQFL